MIAATHATAIIIIFFIIAGVILPILDQTKIFGRFVSFRWTCTVVVLALLIGCMIDFSQLSDTARHSMIIGGLSITALFIVLRSIEKWAARGWNLRHDFTIKKGDFSAKFESNDDESPAAENRENADKNELN